MGCSTRGYHKFRNLPISTISKQQGLSSDNAASIIAAPDGTIWAGNVASLDAIRELRVSSIQSRQGLPGQQITSMLVDHSGRLWLGIDNSLYMYTNRRFTQIRGLDGGPIGFVESLTEDTEHQIWIEAHPAGIGSRHLMRITDGRVRNHTPPQVPESVHVMADPRGGIWLTPTNAGVARLYHGHLDSYPLNHMNFGRSSKPLVEADSSIWAPTRIGAVFIRDGKSQILSGANGLPCNQIYTLINDLHGSLWLYAACGLIEIKKTEVDRWLRDPKARIAWRIFDVLDGAQPSPATFSPASTRSPDGRLWFNNDTIVQLIDPDHLDFNTLPPPVHIEQITASEMDYAAKNYLRLPANIRDTRIDYTALSFVAPQRVRFRVKLQGQDSEWRDVGASTVGVLYKP